MKRIILICLCVISALIAISQVNLEQGLMAYYPFTNGSTQDYKNNFHLTPYGDVGPTADRIGGANSAYSFGGYNDYLYYPGNIFQAWDQGSISVWVSFSTLNKTNQLVYQSCPGNYQGSIQLRNDNGTFSTYLYNNGWGNINQITATNTWYHIVFMWKKENNVFVRKFFMNGELVNSYSVSFNPNQNSGLYFHLGSAAGSNGLCYNYAEQSLNGKLDDVRIYNRSLNQDEINALFNEENVSADFSCDDSSVQSGQAVTFTDNSTGNPTSWLWTFEGGNPGIFNGETPPPIQYNTAGTWDVKLEVSNPNSSDIEFKPDYIIVTSPPQIVINPDYLNFGDLQVGQCSTLNYSITGSGLTSDVTVIAPTGYQVSTQTSSGFANSITVTQTDGNVNQTIYVKFCPDLQQLYEGVITNSSQGTESQSVSISGNGVVLPITFTRTLPAGWSGISSYLIPETPNLDTIFQSIISELVILQSEEEVYWPNQNVNTIGTWDSHKGYVIKVANTVELNITGVTELNKTLPLNQGWNLIPVLSDCKAKITELFNGKDISLIKEVAGLKIYWPAMNVITLDSLLPGNSYFVLMNSADEIIFPECNPVVWSCGQHIIDDRDGKTYNTVQIGDQCWMAQNINVGTRIDGAIEQTNNGTIEKYCYNNLESNCDVYGGMYQWNEMMQGYTSGGAQGICPSGWHLPTDAEWQILEGTVDSQYGVGNPVWNGIGFRGFDAGKNLKSINGWNNDGNGLDLYGFSILPGGYCSTYSGFLSIGGYGGFWTSSNSMMRDVVSGSDRVWRHPESAYGFSVRCIKGEGSVSQLTYAGSDGFICSDYPYFNLDEAQAENYTSLSWTTSGDGYFDDANSLNTVYIAGILDIEQQNVQLCLNAVSIINGEINTDCLDLVIQKTPTVYAGQDTTINPTEFFTTSPVAYYHSGVSWSTTGDGYFDNTGVEITNYYPGTGDLADGHVDLCVVAYAVDPCYTEARDTLTLYFNNGSWACGQSIADSRDGKTYNTVQIGTQCWLAQNLNVGTRINGADEQSDNATIEKYCYNNLESNCDEYGGLYQWNEMMNYSVIPGVQGICMTGWHIPTDEEWTALTNYVSYHPQYLCNSIYIAKALAATTNWNTSSYTCAVGNNLATNNATGFTGLPGGNYYDSSYDNIGYYGVWWSSTEYGSTDARYRLMEYYDRNVNSDLIYKTLGFSVRCLKDETATSQLEVTPSNLNVTADAGSTTFEVTSNVSWSVAENEEWLSVNPLNGSNNGTLTVTYDENPYPESRIGEITVTAEGGTPEITISLTQMLWATVYAGEDATICEGEYYTLDQATAENCSSIQWSTSGDGSFDDPASLNPFYYPGPWDHDAQSIELCLTGESLVPGQSTDDCIVLYIQFLPMVEAGEDATINGNEFFTASPVVSDYSAIEWTSTGDGTFDDSWNLNSTYYPGSQDLVEGQVELCIFAYPIAPCAAVIDDCLILTINNNSWSCGQSMTDERDGKNYNTVLIGSQCWMAQNINVGTRIDGAIEQSNNEIIEKYCYDNLESSCEVYGGLYQWNEVMNYSTTTSLQGICMTGWHLPTDADWCTLTTYLDATVNCSSTDWLGTDAGGKLKETGNTHWSFPNNGASNSSGFTALPGGYSVNNPLFTSINGYGGWWTSSQDDDINSAFHLGLSFYFAKVYRGSWVKSFGLSVRCLKDETNTSQLEVSPLNQDVTADVGSTTFEVTSNVSWSVIENEDWFSVQPLNGSNNGTLTVTYDENPNLESRFGEITVTAEGGTLVVVVTVTQQGQQSWACGQSMTDNRDGKTYGTVQIGTQCWMAQNPNVGTRIDGLNEQSDNSTIEKYCYDNLESNCDVYGGLYQWNEMMQYSTALGMKGVCPTGWHLPGGGEWTILINFLGGENVAGGKMKESGSSHWIPPNTGATNISGFTGLPGGYRSTDASFNYKSADGVWWSATSNEYLAYFINLTFNQTEVGYYSIEKTYGFSVRCLKNETNTSQLEVTPANLDVTSTAGTVTFSVTSNTSWTISESVSWLSVNPSSGTANGTLTVNYDANPSSNTRTGEITVTASGGTPEVVVTVIQQGQQYWACSQSITDERDGKTYNTVLIGSQCWMSQNLNVGTMVAGSANQSNNGTIEKYCYNNSEANCTTYGGLYQWNEMMEYTTTRGVQGICPQGWHVPTDGEWTVLTSFVLNQSAWICGGNTNYYAKALASTTGWDSYSEICTVGNNQASNNASGFAGLPGGYEGADGLYYHQGKFGYWWSSSEYNISYAWSRILAYNVANIYRNNYRFYSFSVRCLKDN